MQRETEPTTKGSKIIVFCHNFVLGSGIPNCLWVLGKTIGSVLKQINMYHNNFR
jgi:hypothetical protein